MADERKCYSGDLTSDAIGKTVRVTYTTGRITSTVEDVLREVRHHLTGPGQRRTTLFFENTRWTSGALLNVTEAGLTVKDTDLVEVLP